jgi:hypothetical protein
MPSSGLRKLAAGGASLILLSLVITSCSDDRSSDLTSPNAANLSKLREAPDGCAFSIADRKGKRMLDLRGDDLPFALPKLPVGPRQEGSGKVFQVDVQDPRLPAPITVTCWVPGTMTEGAFALSTIGTNWPELYARLRHAHYFTSQQLSKPVSQDVQLFFHEKIGKGHVSRPTATTDDIYQCTFVQAVRKGHVNRANFNAIPVSCTCSWMVGDDGNAYNVTCTIDWGGGFADPSTAEPTDGISANPPKGRITYGFQNTFPATDQLSVLMYLEQIICGTVGCSSDDGYTPDAALRLTLSASASYVTQGSYVSFSGHVSDISQLTSLNWTWTPSDGDDLTTASGFCPPIADALVCEMPIYGTGSLELEVSTLHGTATAWALVKMAPLGDGGDLANGPPPDCSNYQSRRGTISDREYAQLDAWCNPNSTYPTDPKVLQNINDALNRIEARGGVCATIAQAVRSVFNNQSQFKVWPTKGSGRYTFQGVTHPILTGDPYMAINGYWALRGAVRDPEKRGFNLDNILAHEGDHLIHAEDPLASGDNWHVLDFPNHEDPGLTTHTWQCGGSP